MQSVKSSVCLRGNRSLMFPQTDYVPFRFKSFRDDVLRRISLEMSFCHAHACDKTVQTRLLSDMKFDGLMLEKAIFFVYFHGW